VTEENWLIAQGVGPVVATAIHAGHSLREEIADLTALDEKTRLREEDPFTDQWLSIAETTIAVSMSRFEVDLNRPREAAVYVKNSDAWELDLWKEAPTLDLINRSLEEYDRFYEDLAAVCDEVAAQHDRFVVLDLHSYNHRRLGPDAPVDPPADNPEINVGTGSVDRIVWGDVVDSFCQALGSYPFDGGHLDVRENVRFRGGHMSRWINERYAGRGCCLAIEVKKIYMDEWTGQPQEAVIVSIGDALIAATQAVAESLGNGATG
jgi:N-formylglutamate amidohydrolase